MNYLLLLLLIVPLIGAIVGAGLPNPRMAKTWALAVSLVTALIALVLVANFDWHKPVNTPADAVQFRFGPGSGDAAKSALALGAIGFSFSLGVDSISLWLVLLTVFLTPLAIAASFESI